MSIEHRRRAMQANRGRTRPERALASRLWRKGLRYLTHKGYESKYNQKLPGHPDLVFPGKLLVIFVDGCFWHGCPSCKGIPERSGEFWANKILGNIARDARITSLLVERGWTVLRVPEHNLRTKSKLAQTAGALVASIRGSEVPFGRDLDGGSDV